MAVATASLPLSRSVAVRGFNIVQGYGYLNRLDLEHGRVKQGVGF